MARAGGQWVALVARRLCALSVIARSAQRDAATFSSKRCTEKIASPQAARNDT